MRNVRIVFLTALVCAAMASAQNKQLLYDYYEIPQSLMLNPGVKTPYKWHFGIPALSGFSAGAWSSGVSVNDLFANDGVDFNTKVREKVIYGMNHRDDFGAGGQLEIFNFGFRNPNRPRDYYSLGVYAEGFTNIYWPQDLAILAFEGNANNLNRLFDLSHLTGQGEAVSVFHIGVNRKINRKLTLGLRGKLYSSIFHFESTRNEGHFITTPGENNILRNTLVSRLVVNTAGVEGFLDALDSTSSQSELASLLIKRSLLGGNLGVGFDAGFTYELSPKTFVTGSILDVGFIYYNKDVRNHMLSGAASNEGIEIVLPEDLLNLNDDIWQDLVDDIETLIPFTENDRAYFSLRPIKLYGSIRHNFGEPKEKTEDCECSYKTTELRDNFDYVNSFGAQFYAIGRPKGPQMALTAFYQKRLGKLLAFKTTYTVDKYSLTNVGLGLNVQAGPVNFYVMADNLLAYRNIPNSRYASFQFGFNILSWNDN